MYQSSELPDLKMLPTQTLFPHEDCDPRRVEKLSKRLLEEGILKSPPIVAKVPDTDKYVVLDGANRVTTFKSLGIPHIVAQLVSYDRPGVLLDTWYHVVSGMNQADFEKQLDQIPELILKKSELEKARNLVGSGEIVAYIVNDHGVRIVVSEIGAYNKTSLSLLNLVVGTYKGKADIFRASNDVWEIQKPCYPEITALVIFPRLKPNDILGAVSNGEKIPSGITRHIIPERAININIPIGILMADLPYDLKCKWLDEWYMERMSANAIRFYAESTFTFNE